MSKVGQKPISIPQEVKVNLEGKRLKVTGSLGEQVVVIPENLKAVISENEIRVERELETKKVRSLHGTYARLIQNAIIGVSRGFEKILEIVGTGYRGIMEQDVLVLSLGYSHQIRVASPTGIKLSVEENKIKVFGIDKELVGTTAHNIKILRKPDSYKGKGIRFLGEKLRLKPGKAAAKTTGAA